MPFIVRFTIQRDFSVSTPNEHELVCRVTRLC